MNAYNNSMYYTIFIIYSKLFKVKINIKLVCETSSMLYQALLMNWSENLCLKKLHTQ